MTIAIERQYTPAEIAAWESADVELWTRGLDRGNGDTLLAYFETNRRIPCLLPNIHAAVDVLRDQLKWRPHFQEWDRVSKENPKVAVAVANWLLGGARTQHVPEAAVVANTVLNALNITKELLHYGSRAITNDLLWRIVAAIPQLEKAEPQTAVDATYRPGRLFEKGEVNRSYAEAVRQSHPQEPQSTGPTPEQAAETEAEKLVQAICRDGSWSDRDEYEKVRDRERKRGRSWAETLQILKSVQTSRRQSRYRGEAAIQV